ncbi:hypothetical protein RISK_006076 [Rhodopirellula islandica]|uniref:Secreted protein n=2 Tax=Rhodopirellula islandica TaxID=595434 RepID=A0A0J1B5A5_RHOIS|nr:hypothetical protein RISK_006076 [Rhodopirellula islandica]
MKRLCLVALVAGMPLTFTGCGPGGNTVVESEDGPMTEQELQDYEEQAQQQTENYEDNYR